MTRALLNRIRALEDRSGAAAVPGVVLFPGQEPPAGWIGPVVRVQVVDSSKPSHDHNSDDPSV